MENVEMTNNAVEVNDQTALVESASTNGSSGVGFGIGFVSGVGATCLVGFVRWLIKRKKAKKRVVEEATEEVVEENSDEEVE